jgi:hypothetical protein
LRLPERPTREEAPKRPSKRNRPGNRNPLARQSIADLVLEVLEMAARREALRLAARALEQQLNRHTGDPVGPQLPCPCEGSARYIMVVTAKPSKVYSGRCTHSGLTITVNNASADSHETGLAITVLKIIWEDRRVA